jgi:hypothetical protein
LKKKGVNLPSFLKDNPWVRILSKRGKIKENEYKI